MISFSKTVWTVLCLASVTGLNSEAAVAQEGGSPRPMNTQVEASKLLPYTKAALDAQTRRILDDLAAHPGPPAWALPPEQVRQSFDAFFAAYALPNPNSATRQNRKIPVPGAEISISVFRPRSERPDAKLPVLVYYHGGGMMANSTDTYDSMLQTICSEAGIAIVSVDYRLAPEYRFPTPIDDSYAAFLWVHEHADELNVDPDRLAVGGDSAGGNIAAVVTHQARDQKGPPLRFQVLIYPAVGLSGDSASIDQYAEGYFFGKAELAWTYAQYVSDAAQYADPRVQPILSKNFANLPPALIIVPEFDILRDDGEKYGELLKKAGVRVEQKRYPGTIHGFVNMGGAIPAGRAAISQIAGGLRLALAPVRAAVRH